MKNATAISHGSNLVLEPARATGEEGVSIGSGELGFFGLGCIGLRSGGCSSFIYGALIIPEARFDFIGANAHRHFRHVPGACDERSPGKPVR
jgi:hypothetical protein